MQLGGAVAGEVRARGRRRGRSGGGASPERSSSTSPSTTASRTWCSPKHALVEVLEAVGEGRVAQRAVEAVGPGVVRALQAREPALGLVDQAGAAVAAGVAERAREAVVVGDDEHAVVAELDGQILAARCSDLVDVAGADPLARGRGARTSHVRARGVGERAPGSCVACSSGRRVRSMSSSRRSGAGTAGIGTGAPSSRRTPRTLAQLRATGNKVRTAGRPLLAGWRDRPPSLPYRCRSTL